MILKQIITIEERLLDRNTIDQQVNIIRIIQNLKDRLTQAKWYCSE